MDCETGRRCQLGWLLGVVLYRKSGCGFIGDVNFGMLLLFGTLQVRFIVRVARKAIMMMMMMMMIFINVLCGPPEGYEDVLS